MSTTLAWSQSLLHLHPKASIVSSDAYSESEVIREKQLFCVRDPCATHLWLPLTVLFFFRRCLHAMIVAPAARDRSQGVEPVETNIGKKQVEIKKVVIEMVV